MNLRALPRGRENARPMGDIAESVFMSRRRVERAIEALVLSGIPIIACERGVYTTDAPDEIDAYADALEARIASQLHRIRALRRAAEKRRGQGTLWAA